MTAVLLPTQHPDPAIQALSVLAATNLDAAIAQVRTDLTKETTR